MYDLNKVMLIGRITKEIELKQTKSGTAFCNFDLAMTMSKNKETGNVHTEYVKCEIWEQSAKMFCEYANKGALIYVEGSLKTTTQETDSGKKYFTNVSVKDFKVLNNPTGATTQPKSMNETAEDLDMELQDVDLDEIQTPF